MVHCARWGGKMCCARAWFHVKCFGFDVKWFTSPPGGSVLVMGLEPACSMGIPTLPKVLKRNLGSLKKYVLQIGACDRCSATSQVATCQFTMCFFPHTHSGDGRWIFGTGQNVFPPPNGSFATEIDQPHLWAPWRPSDLTRPIFPICSSYAWCNPHEIPSESPWLLIFRADFFGWAERFNGLWLLAYLTVRLWYALNMCSLPSKRWKSMKYVPLHKNYATDMILTFSGLVAGSHLSCLSFAFQAFINNRNFTLLPQLIPQ